MTARTPKYLRRLALATLLAAAATFSVSAFGGSVSACAAPREWDIGFYDDCMQAANDAWQADEITNAQWFSEKANCCAASGGEFEPYSGDCMAPPAEEAERQPAPPEFGDPSMTLWMPPPPAGPAAPPPSEAVPSG
jgi:hypothetical protein